MKLYYSDVLMPRKACAVAQYLRSPVDYIYLDLIKGEHKTADYLALNPNGKVPTLVDGDRAFWESDVIMCHLSDRAGADLWPHDDRQLEVLRWLSWAAQHYARCGGALYFEGVIKARFGIGEPDASVVDEEIAHFRRFSAVLDAHLDGRTWLVGDRLSVADFAVAVALPYAEPARMPLAEFPHVARWHDRLSELPAWREPFPQRATTSARAASMPAAAQ
ncbi:MAG: glutathione S-transferase family protein [Acidisphaera sp.]|nr:glutathione S-transferase family protein [Acidisphaera sp.]